MTETNPAETSSTPDPVISSSSVLKPEPLSECPDENLMSRPYQPEYHHMDFMTIQQGIKQEPGTFDSPDTVVGYQSWQESKLPGNVSLKEELIVLSGKTEDQQVPTPQPNLQQPGDEIKCERMKLESTRSEGPSDWYIGIPGKLEKEIVDCVEVREGNSRLVEPCAQKPPVPVALYTNNAKQPLYRHIAKRMATVENDNLAHENLKGQGEKQIILSCSPAMNSSVTTADDVTDLGNERNECSLFDNKSVIKSNLEQTSFHVSEKLLNCTVCEYRCTNSNSLTVHMETHTGEKTFRCTVCDHKFSKERYLTIHTRTHTGEKPFMCTVCDYRSASNSNLVVHKRTHSGEKPYKCDFCGLRFTRKTGLTTHIRTHTGEKPFRCSICCHKFFRKWSLTSHMRNHTGEKPYICTVCDHRFANSSALVVHKRIHSGEKPYKCDFCGFRCNNSAGHTTHMRTHTGEKPYICTICDYRSASSSALVLHMRKHSGEKPYKCNLCGFRTIKKSSLTAHLRQHTDAKAIE